MLNHILLGSGFAFAAVVQPGPLQAFLLSRVLSHGWRRTLPAALAPAISDGPIAVLMLAALGTVPAPVVRGLRIAGGLYLLALAWWAFRDGWRGGRRDAAAPAAPRTLRQAIVVNLLNPNPYLGWAFVLGPAALAGWAEAPSRAVALVTAFYATMTLGLAAFIAACGSASLLTPRAQRGLLLASAAALAALGVFQLLAGVVAPAR